jgi:hypothetical protein
MRAINKNNYEAWFLDYFEGNLSAEQSELLFSFLDEHPELQEAFNEYEPVSLEPTKEEMNKSFLLKPISNELANEISGTDYTAISYTENILSANKKAEINTLLQEDKSLAETIRIYSKLKLQPDLSIVYKEKSKLRKPVVIPIGYFKNAYRAVASIAAVALLFFAVWNFNAGKPEYKALAVSTKRILPENKLQPVQMASKTIETGENKIQKSKKVNYKNNVLISTNYKIPVNNDINNSVDENKTIEIVNNDKEISSLKTPENIVNTDILSNNNVETIKIENFESPQSILVSKLLKSPIPHAAETAEKSRKFWDILDVTSKRYSELTGRKVKVKKVDREDNSSVFALISDKFELSHTRSKK